MGAKLELRIPPPIVTLLVMLLMYLISRYTMRYYLPYGLDIILAIIIAGGAIALAMNAVIAFKKEQTTVNPLQPESASTLVTRGIFRYSRNPMYLSLAFLLIAWMLWLSAPLSIVGVVIFVCYMTQFQIKPEERALFELFGQQFSDYCQHTRRWI